MKFSGNQSWKFEFPPVVDAFPSGKTDFQPLMLLLARLCAHGKFLWVPRQFQPGRKWGLVACKVLLKGDGS